MAQARQAAVEVGSSRQTRTQVANGYWTQGKGRAIQDPQPALSTGVGPAGVGDHSTVSCGRGKPQDLDGRSVVESRLSAPLEAGHCSWSDPWVTWEHQTCSPRAGDRGTPASRQSGPQVQNPRLTFLCPWHKRGTWGKLAAEPESRVSVNVCYIQGGNVQPHQPHRPVPEVGGSGPSQANSQALSSRPCLAPNHTHPVFPV